MTIKDEDTHPDIINMNIDGDTPVSVIVKLLAELDREVTGYPYEEYDEDGDNPEECFSDPSIDGYWLEYNEEGYIKLAIYLQRDPERLKAQWRSWFGRLWTFKLKIISVWAHRVCLEGDGNFKPEWDSIVKGKVPRLAWGFDGLRGIHRIDLDNPSDRKLLQEWINYIFENYRDPPELDYYNFKGSLGLKKSDNPTK